MHKSLEMHAFYKLIMTLCKMWHFNKTIFQSEMKKQAAFKC